MENLAYYNGEYGLAEEMKIPFNDRVCFFGDGVYDATCMTRGRFYHLDEHIDRFFNSAAMLRIEIPHSKAELRAILEEMTAKVEGEYLFIYWQITRGTAPRNHIFPVGVKSNLWIIVRPCDPPDFETRIKLTEMEDKRYEYCNIKTLNLLPNVLASQKCEEEGCDECVFHRGETVTECAHSNISILKDGVFITHPLDEHILPGTGRAHLISACKALGVPVEERTYTVAEMCAADEVIVSSCGKLCRMAGSYCGQPVGGKDTATAKKLQDWVRAELGV